MRIGQLVEVRSKEEILRTLDKKGRLEGLPFMPEMLEHCGKRFRVYRIAHKACDSVIINNSLQYKGRKMKGTVFLEGLRCNGASHGGCDAACLIFWKEAWLKALDTKEKPPLSNHFGPKPQKREVPICREEDLRAGTRSAESNTFICQATQLSAATSPLSPFDLRQYLEDYRSGNVGAWRMICSFIYVGYSALANAGLKLGRPLRLLYDLFARLIGGIPYPRKPGDIPLGKPTPAETLNLKPGEWVRVKSHKAILATLDHYGRNRGMYFVADQVPYCNRTFQIFKRVDQIIDEGSGHMIKMKTQLSSSRGPSARHAIPTFAYSAPGAPTPIGGKFG